MPGAFSGVGAVNRDNSCVLIRRERSTDIEAIRAVIASAFADSDQLGVTPAEVALVDDLRASESWLPELSLVAIEPSEEMIGHVLCTRGYLGTTPALALAPLGVRSDQQRRGVGQALMHAVLGAADALTEPFVALLGDPGYYARFGFRLAQDFNIVAPVPAWTPHFQVRTLTAYTAPLDGKFFYPAAFDRYIIQ